MRCARSASRRSSASRCCCTTQWIIRWRSGARSAPAISPSRSTHILNVSQYAYILADCRASALVVAAPLAQTIWPLIEKLPHLRTVILVGAIVDDKAAFPGRDVHLFEDVLAAADCHAVYRRHGVRRGRVLALYLRLDRRPEGRQARPFQPDGDGETVRPRHAWHYRERRRSFRRKIVFRLWARQRHDLSTFGRRHRGAVAGAARRPTRCSR